MDVARGPDGGRWMLNSIGRNNLLSALPVAERERIMKSCDKRQVENRAVFYQPNAPSGRLTSR